MIRIGAFLVGLFFSGWLLVSFGVGAAAYISEPPQPTAEHEFHLHPKKLALSSDGPMGKFDRQQLQRGFQVYKEVCSACHSMRLVAFRNLTELGYTEDEVKAIAANWATQTPSIDPATGEPTTRKPLPQDYIPSPHANETAARAANNNALPPDLSLITKARHGGAAYVYSLLTGYQDPPAELAKKFPDAMPGPGLNYNPYFANLNIAMANPLGSDGIVTYSDGTNATREQMAKDVAAFLVWTAEPTLEKRHQTGWAVLIFLIIATGLGYMAYRNVWAGVKH
ncbi:MULTISPECIES: cytochrome c1 [Pseudomonadota]|jgi:ubiquinol-cytochrome c reductase cytochrome c1 subunit|uniref:Cytochrome c1 n=3 Tax=Sphingomonadales TaxID=204457 RepID=A0A7V8UAB3_9SPHN|nr:MULTISPECIES: cytochrome c1 [Pseudomonadota]MBA4779647.1 cytochrome c1 [Blastomonas sp.]OHC93838.1 MAG: cytochrome C [Sphingomonadales bacterium RIFCSPHIGHO2_01_FULL_65_20]MBA1376175.1 cytochrome c1 [Sphingomonas ursincola]MBY0621231.1 cytochrome c1 [Sphingomonas ursincola]MCH2239618.1 cytochrome c1 [Blastomonas sp.]